MRISYGPDSNTITDSQGRMVFLSDAEIAELARSLQVTADADDEPVTTFVHPTVGPMPGYAVGHCGHRVAVSEWRAGFRNCERCGESS